MSKHDTITATVERVIPASPETLYGIVTDGSRIGEMSPECRSATWVGKTQAAEVVGSDFTLPDYTTIRVFGDINVTEGLSVRLDVDNLFDETFYTNSFANVWVQPGTPRQFRVTASYAF